MEKLNLTPVAQRIILALRTKLQSMGHDGLASKVETEYGYNSFRIVMPYYGLFLDSGTKPHMPPVDAIDRWIKDKGLNLNAWAVATNIKKFGTKAQPFLFVVDDVLAESETLDFFIDEYKIALEHFWLDLKTKFKA